MEELAEQCNVVLERLGLNGGDSRRVRWEPSPRVLRYYTTLGLLDRAARMVGRTAFYGRRHLLQLLAIKKLQHDGKTLQEIQADLLGKSNGELADTAGIVDEHELTVEETPPVPARRERFWEAPAALPEVTVTPAQVVTRELSEIEIGPGCALTFDRNLYPNLDLEALAPLLERLKQEIQSHQ